MTDFPLRLEYNAGFANAPGDPFGRTELMIEADGRARLVHEHVGAVRAWTGKVELATLRALWAALERGGFPEIPRHAIPGGSALRTVLAHDATGAKRGGDVAWNSARDLPGYADAFAMLDSIVRQLSEGTCDAAPDTLPSVVTDIVREVS